jgi:hypothetical protein
MLYANKKSSTASPVASRHLHCSSWLHLLLTLSCRHHAYSHTKISTKQRKITVQLKVAHIPLTVKQLLQRQEWSKQQQAALQASLQLSAGMAQVLILQPQ